MVMDPSRSSKVALAMLSKISSQVDVPNMKFPEEEDLNPAIPTTDRHFTLKQASLHFLRFSINQDNPRQMFRSTWDCILPRACSRWEHRSVVDGSSWSNSATEIAETVLKLFTIALCTMIL